MKTDKKGSSHPVGNLLHVIDELAGMIAVSHGMAYKDGKWNLRPSALLSEFSESDEREQEQVVRIGVLRKGCEAEPRQARHRAEIGRLSGSCLDDSGYVTIPIHVLYNSTVKHVEVGMIFAPDIGKCLVFGMEKRVARYYFLPVPQFAFGIEAHAELLVLIDRMHDDVQHQRKEAQFPFLLYFPQMCDVKAGIQVVLAFDLREIVLEVDISLPRSSVNDVKSGVHIAVV